MHTVVIFGTNKLPLSWAIRFFTRSRWSHVGVVSNGMVYESVFGEGVRISSLKSFTKKYPRYAIAAIPCNQSVAIEAIKKELGKPYDLKAIFGLLLWRKWDKKNAWFCSELVAHASGLFRKTGIKRVTPEDIWKVSTDI
tara:strand:- start:4436 stop:4852 length:417 start_codon:yes stop_codon:yes gene_type:complete